MTKDVTINIKPPLNRGGSEILYYQYNIDGGAWRSVLPHRIPIVAKNLHVGQEYNINIRAVNKAGASPTSQISVIPSGTPDSPTIDDLILNNNNLEVHYSLNNDNGAEITDVEYRISGQRFFSSNLDNPIIINRGFRSGRIENISIRAKNKNGYSPTDSDSINIPIEIDLPSFISFNVAGGDEQITMNWNIDDGNSDLINLEYEIEEN